MTAFQIKMHFLLVSMRYVRDGGDGICSNVEKPVENFIFYSRVINWLLDSFKKWMDYSGNANFPVPSPNKSLSAAHFYHQTNNYWTGAYGKKRKELLEFLIEEIQKDA